MIHKLIKTTYFPFISLKLAKDGFKTDYIARYYLWFSKRIFINIIKGSENVLHTHPWDYTSIILWGGYKETTLKGTKVYKPGSVIRKKHSDFHALKLLKKNCITLFFVSKPKVKSQLFLVNGKVLNDFEYQLSLCKTIEQKKKLVQAYKSFKNNNYVLEDTL